jgi:hypothetical protein
MGGREGASEFWWMRVSPEGRRTSITEPRRCSGAGVDVVAGAGAGAGAQVGAQGTEGDPRRYLLTAEDVGCVLRVKCRPTRSDGVQGEIFTSACSEEVRPENKEVQPDPTAPPTPTTPTPIVPTVPVVTAPPHTATPTTTLAEPQQAGVEQGGVLETPTLPPPEVVLPVQSGTESETETLTVTEAEAETVTRGAGTETGSEAEIETEVETEAEPEAEAETEAAAEPEAMGNLESGTAPVLSEVPAPLATTATA